MSILQVSENKIGFKQQLNNTQVKFIAKALAIAAIGFGLICGIGYLFYFAYLKNWISTNELTVVYVLASISLFALIIISIIMSFMKKINIPLLATLYILFIFSFGVLFSSLFYLFQGGELLMLFGISAASLLVCAILGFTMSNKVAIRLRTILYILIPIYFIFSLVYALVSLFVFNTSNWSYIIYTLIGVVIIFCLNIFSFYNLSKTSEFIALNENNNDQKQVNSLAFVVGLDILGSVVNTIMIVARILLLSRS